MLLLVSVLNLKVWHWGGFQWHNIICSVMKPGRLVQKSAFFSFTEREQAEKNSNAHKLQQ
jgi:hypothetical protein